MAASIHTKRAYPRVCFDSGKTSVLHHVKTDQV